MTKQHTHQLEKLTINITKWMGTPQSIFLHTIFFVGVFFLVPVLGLDQVMLVLTTAVSLEAIYLSLFIQMTVNRNTESLLDVEEDIEEIQEDVENVEGDIDRIQDHVENLGEEVEDISEDIDRFNETDTPTESQPQTSTEMLLAMQKQLSVITADLQHLRQTVSSIKEN